MSTMVANNLPGTLEKAPLEMETEETVACILMFLVCIGFQADFGRFGRRYPPQARGLRPRSRRSDRFAGGSSQSCRLMIPTLVVME